MAAAAAPRISVLLPVFDGATTLEACLTSIARQSEPRFECIVVDDGSRDATPRILAARAARDRRFIVVREPHRGLVGALNAGLQRCRGALVARMDADDLMHRHRLRDQRRFLLEHDLDGCGCHVRIFPRSGLRDGRRDYERWLNGRSDPDDVAREAWVECPVAHPTLLLRREPLVELGYRDRGWPEDYDLLLRLLAAGRRVGVLPQRRLAWRDAPGRLSRTGAAYRLERFQACRAWHLARTFLAGSEHYVLWGYGSTGRALRRALLAEGKRPQHIVELHPGRVGNRIHGAPVIPPERLREVPRRPLLVSVAGAAPRAEIRGMLAALDFAEGRDFVCCA